VSPKRQPWGSVRKLPSGRFQARYRVDGALHTAPTTFATKRDADAFLAEVRTTLERGTWVNPAAGKITLEEYSTRWLAERVQLRIRTRELYELRTRQSRTRESRTRSVSRIGDASVCCVGRESRRA
jgi:hypothetical protein